MTQLTEFQHRSLCDAARNQTGLYLLIRPSRIADAHEQFVQFVVNNDETDALVSMGLLSDVSEEFQEQIVEAARIHSREFRVFKITDQGKVMFNDSSPSTPVI